MQHRRSAARLLTRWNPACATAMAVSDLVKLGQKEIKSTDDALKRSQRIVEDTVQVWSPVRAG